MIPVKSRCTYLKLCGSINDAPWDDEHRIVTGWEQKYEEEGSEQREADRGKERMWHEVLVIFPLVGPLQAQNLSCEPQKVEEEAAPDEGVFIVWRDPNYTRFSTAIFQRRKCYTAVASCSEKQGILWQRRNKAAVRFEWTKPWGRLQHTSKDTVRARNLARSSKGKFTLNKNNCSPNIALQDITGFQSWISDEELLFAMHPWTYRRLPLDEWDTEENLKTRWFSGKFWRS